MATDLVRVGQHDVTREATVRVFRGFVQAYSAASERRQRAPTTVLERRCATCRTQPRNAQPANAQANRNQNQGTLSPP